LADREVSLEFERAEVGARIGRPNSAPALTRRSSTFGPKSDAVTASAVAPQRGVTV
jgi:hypothetical protein